MSPRPDWALKRENGEVLAAGAAGPAAWRFCAHASLCEVEALTLATRPLPLKPVARAPKVGLVLHAAVLVLAFRATFSILHCVWACVAP